MIEDIERKGLEMNLYLVKTPADGFENWVAYEHPEGDLYVFVQNTGKFHRNGPLTTDYYVHQELTYEPIDAAAAQRAIAAGEVGKLDARSQKWILDRYLQDENWIDPQDILGVKYTRTEAEVRDARLRVLREAKPGVSITWKSYPLEKIHLARVATNDIRKKRIKALSSLGDLDSWVEKSNEEALVKVARSSSEGTTSS